MDVRGQSHACAHLDSVDEKERLQEREAERLADTRAAVGEAFNCATPSLVTCDSLVRLFTARTASLHRPSRE